MEQSDVVLYLANVLSIARADGVLSPSEEKAAEEVRVSIKARKTDLKQASQLAEDPSFSCKAVGRYSEKVRNIEDMVYLALADGDLADAETTSIVEFAKAIGITQEQVDEVLAEAKQRVRGREEEIDCPSCLQTIPAASKFCPECGAHIEVAGEAEGTRLTFDYPATGVAIEFAQSSSASFDEAMTEAKSSPDFQECERGRKKWYLAAWPSGQVADSLALANCLSGLRNRKAYVDGKEMPWDEAFSFCGCFYERQEAYRPTEYCFGVDDNRLNVWGCRQARMDWTNWARWFSYGRFRKNDIFVFDKERIRHELETNLYKVRFCPCIRFQLVGKVLEMVPDEVRVSPRHGWEYNREYDEGPNSIKIVEKRREDGYTYTDEFYTDGVRPCGTSVGLQLLRSALKACAISDVNVKSLG